MNKILRLGVIFICIGMALFSGLVIRDMIKLSIVDNFQSVAGINDSYIVVLSMNAHDITIEVETNPVNKTIFVSIMDFDQLSYLNITNLEKGIELRGKGEISFHIKQGGLYAIVFFNPGNTLVGINGKIKYYGIDKQGLSITIVFISIGIILLLIAPFLFLSLWVKRRTITHVA